VTLRQTVRLDLESGETQTVTVDGRDLRAWEAWREASALDGRVTVTKLTEWGYLAGKRQGLWNGEYEDWEPTCIGVTPVATDVANPTQPGLSEDPSSPSPSEQGSARKTGKIQGKQRY
jgi:hypothetical protein